MRIALLLALSLLAGCSSAPATDGGTGGGTGGGATGGGTGGGTSDGGADAGQLRVLVMFDSSQSLTVTDPNATRIEALRQFFNALPNEPSTGVAVMAFSGSTTAYFASPTAEFVPLSSLASSDRNTLYARLASFTTPGDGGTEVRDFVGPLNAAYAMASSDVARLPGARYSVIFLSDGRPTTNQDNQLLCGDVVKQLHDLRLTGAAEVKVHTVHVFAPNVAPGCTGDAGWMGPGNTCEIPLVGNPGACASAEVDENASRLRQMSVVGGGQFRDVRGQQSVSFTGLAP